MPPNDTRDLVPADFFVLRSPLLPFDELARWSAGLATLGVGVEDSDRLAATVATDRATLRLRLESLLARPEIHEALLVASPSLLDGLDTWRRDPEGKKGRRVEQSLVRYVERMSTRATPFGLFSGCTVGTVGGETSLHLGDRSTYRRHTRLDSDYLYQLCDALGRAPDLEQRQAYRVSSSLYRIGGRIRYAESHLSGRSRTHHLVAVDSDAYLEHALELAQGAVTADELARSLVELDPEAEVSLDEAREFVDDLIESQVLVPEVAPAVTCHAPLDELIEQLRDLDVCHSTVAVLDTVRTRLAALDARPVGGDLAAYPEVASALAALPPRVDPARLLQVDLMKPGAVSLGASVIAEIESGVHLLHRLAGGSAQGQLALFRRAFLDRHEPGEEVPLVEALDDELGIGFGRVEGLDGDPSPLLDGLAIGAPAADARADRAGWSPMSQLLLDKLEPALRQGAFEIEITSEDLASLPDDAAPLPDAFVVKARLAAGCEEDVAAGEFELLFELASGPSGAQMLGRFCHADRGLEEGVRRHLRREESLDPDAIYAEVVHVPEGRMGNIIVRPVLRDHEIPFLGRSGADATRQIAVTDLLVSVVGDQVVLRSRRLGRRVVPRLTNAHNFVRKSLGIYRFLCALQFEGFCPGLTWSWGPLAGLAFLPRVRSGRVVLSRARWGAAPAEIEHLKHPDPSRRLAAVRRWRQARGVPRHALLADGESELFIDFDNILSVDAFAAMVGRRERFELVEMFPPPERLCARGPEGHFLHELLVPFTRRASGRPRAAPAPASGQAPRTFAPGSEWLYAKLYTGTATADRVLTDVVWPLTQDALDAGTIDRWFFLRYADPEAHLRLRFHGPRRALLSDLLPALEQAVAPLLASGEIWRFQLQEYRRELERYGGAAGIGLAERLFHFDSDAVVEILRRLPESDGADMRWRLALLGTDRWIADLDTASAGRLELLTELKRGWAREFRVDGSPLLKKQLAHRLRREMPSLRSLLFDPLAADDSHAAGLAALRRRSERSRPVIAELAARERAGALSLPMRSIAPSLVHMFNNRLFRSRGREHELVLSDFLERLHRSRAHRERARGDRAREAGQIREKETFHGRR